MDPAGLDPTHTKAECVQSIVLLCSASIFSQKLPPRMFCTDYLFQILLNIAVHFLENAMGLWYFMTVLCLCDIEFCPTISLQILELMTNASEAIAFTICCNLDVAQH